MKHIGKFSISLLAACALSLSGTAVASAQTTGLSSALFGSSSATNSLALAQSRLVAAHEDWIRVRDIERDPQLDGFAREYADLVRGEPLSYYRNDWGLFVTQGYDDWNNGIQIIRYTEEQANYWAGPHLLETFDPEYTGPMGMGASNDGEYIYMAFFTEAVY